MRHMNESITGRIDDNFITGLSVAIDLKKRRLTYSNAGHPMGLLYSLEPVARRTRYLRPNSRILGIFPRQKFREFTVPLPDRCRLVLYTDGMTETFDASGAMFGERKFLKIFRELRDTDLNGAVTEVERLLKQFRGHDRGEDDRSMVLADIDLR